MTEAQRHFLTGRANPMLVLALLASGGGYIVHQNTFTADEATRLSAARDRFEALQQHCTEREIDDLKERAR